MAIHELPLTSLYNVSIKKDVKYLGITISKDVERIEMLNIDKKNEKCKSVMNSWLQRDFRENIAIEN